MSSLFYILTYAIKYNHITKYIITVKIATLNQIICFNNKHTKNVSSNNIRNY